MTYDQHLNIRLTKQQKKLIEKASQRDNRKPSDFVRLIVLEHIEKTKGV